MRGRMELQQLAFAVDVNCCIVDVDDDNVDVVDVAVTVPVATAVYIRCYCPCFNLLFLQMQEESRFRKMNIKIKYHAVPPCTYFFFQLLFCRISPLEPFLSGKTGSALYTCIYFFSKNKLLISSSSSTVFYDMFMNLCTVHAKY